MYGSFEKYLGQDGPALMNGLMAPEQVALKNKKRDSKKRHLLDAGPRILDFLTLNSQKSSVLL